MNVVMNTIGGSRRGDYKHFHLLGNDAVHTGIKMPTFQRRVLPPSAGYKKSECLSPYLRTRRPVLSIVSFLGSTKRGEFLTSLATTLSTRAVSPCTIVTTQD